MLLVVKSLQSLITISARISSSKKTSLDSIQKPYQIILRVGEKREIIRILYKLLLAADSAAVWAAGCLGGGETDELLSLISFPDISATTNPLFLTLLRACMPFFFFLSFRISSYYSASVHAKCWTLVLTGPSVSRS